MKKLLKSILIMSILPLSACSISDKQKEGDLVTWQVTPQLIIKTELGLQRELIAHSPGSPLYDDPHIKYVGVLTLDHKPFKYEKISVDNAKVLNQSKNTKDKAYNLTFDLALNNAKFLPNDYNIHIDKVMVHPNQVRVEINNNLHEDYKVISEDEVKKGKYDSEFSKSSNLECYLFNKEINTKSEVVEYSYHQCIGKPENKSLPNIIIKIVEIDSKKTIANFNLEQYGVNVVWRTDTTNILLWENICNQIISLIEAWNVAPNY